MDDQGNLVPPMHVAKTVEESLLVVPTDPRLPTYTGHSTVHVTNSEDSPNAGFTNTITLRGTDGLAELRGVLLNEHEWRQREGLD